MKGNKMKKLLVALTLVLFVSSLSFAQLNKNWDGTKPEVYTGSKSFIFIYSPFVSNALSGNLVGNVFNNTFDTLSVPSANVSNLFGVGFQYYVSNNISLGGAISFGTTTITDQPSVTATPTNKITNTVFGVSVDGNYHFKSLYSVSPYLGINVNFTTQSFNDDISNQVSGGPSNIKSTGSFFGAGLNFGFDWYFTPGLSLGGKYTLGFQTTGGTEVKVQTASFTNTNDGPKQSLIGTGIASIMLNVHF
jgi:hypothetical protein